MEAFIHLNRVSERRNPSSMSESPNRVGNSSLVNARVTRFGVCANYTYLGFQLPR
jgi:hypothetical protein